MLNTLMQWIKEIFIISILSEIFITLISSRQYKKYAGYITGLMIICICVKMIFLLLNVEINEKSLSYFEKNIIYSDASLLENSTNELYVRSYIDANIQYIEEYAADFGLTVINTEIVLDDAAIASIEVSVTGSNDYEKCMEFKKALAAIYDTASSNISVYLKK